MSTWSYPDRMSPSPFSSSAFERCGDLDPRMFYLITVVNQWFYPVGSDDWVQSSDWVFHALHVLALRDSVGYVRPTQVDTWAIPAARAGFFYPFGTVAMEGMGFNSLREDALAFLGRRMPSLIFR